MDGARGKGEVKSGRRRDGEGGGCGENVREREEGRGSLFDVDIQDDRLLDHRM